MKIIITVQEAFDLGIWEQVCDKRGYNYYAVSEGLNKETEIDLTKEEAIELKIITENDNS